jgi:hypothetical protein
LTLEEYAAIAEIIFRRLPRALDRLEAQVLAG